MKTKDLNLGELINEIKENLINGFTGLGECSTKVISAVNAKIKDIKEKLKSIEK